MLMYGMPGPFELAVIFLVVLLVFGPSKLKDVGRSLGQGIREFRKAMRGGDEPPDKGETKDNNKM